MIDSQTKVYGIVGNPVDHSLSPIIHNQAFKRAGLNAAYLAFPVEDLEDAVKGIRGLGVRGVSVTIPFKTRIITFLDELDPAARRIRAVNTVVNEGGRLIGYNTDWCGAVEALEENLHLNGKLVLLLGAGGAARAVGFGLKERGTRLMISNRSPDRGQELARDLGCLYTPFPSINKDEIDVVVNATPVGMLWQPDESPFPRRDLKKRMTVMDLVYRPLRTRLLQEAEEEGCRTINGLEMLIRQAAEQILLWTGIKPDLDEIRGDLRKALGEIETRNVNERGGVLSGDERDRDRTTSAL